MKGQLIVGETLDTESSGYWVMQGNPVVRETVSKCVTCRHLRGKVGGSSS